MLNNSLDELADFHTLANHISLLTSREREVYDMLYSPLSIREIAVNMDLSYKTVQFHLTNMYRKLRVSNRNQLLGKILINTQGRSNG